MEGNVEQKDETGYTFKKKLNSFIFNIKIKVIASQ